MKAQETGPRTLRKGAFHLSLFMTCFLLLGSVSTAQVSKGGKEMGAKEIREPAVAGTWYSDNPDVLSKEIRRYLGDAKKESIGGRVIALVAPHAGYRYSGLVAAYAYKLIEGETFETVVVVAPSHQTLFKGASLYDR